MTEERGESEPIWGSMIKQAIKRRHPGFNERFYGFRSFNDMLADAEKRGLLTLRPDEKSGGYTVRVDRPPRPQSARIDRSRGCLVRPAPPLNFMRLAAFSCQ